MNERLQIILIALCFFIGVLFLMLLGTSYVLSHTLPSAEEFCKQYDMKSTQVFAGGWCYDDTDAIEIVFINNSWKFKRT